MAHFMPGHFFSQNDYIPSLPVNYAEDTYGLELGLGSYRGQMMIIIA